jgi:hypothetical protein
MMSWGIRISILYLAFVALILTMVGMTMREKEDLESKDYYAQEIKYQSKIDLINRTDSLKEPSTWAVIPGSISLKFPKQFQGENISGSVDLIRPSDASVDKTIPILKDTSRSRNISTEKLKKGVYKIKINWKADKKEYYNEGIIQIK